MPDYEATTVVSAASDTVFSYLSDVDNLPNYFARMTSAEPGDGDAVQVTADVHGHQVDGEAWFQVDDETKVISWGSEGPNNYHGQLRVEDANDTGDTSRVTVTLTTDRGAADEIQQGLKQTLANIQKVIQTD